MIRLGLCCKFYEEDIKFKEIRYIHIKNLSQHERRQKIAAVILNNLESLILALKFCFENHILSMRVSSTLLPLYTHPDCYYSLKELPHGKEILELFEKASHFAQEKRIRLSFHPDQFTVLNSPRADVVENSIENLRYHNYLSELLKADVINIHAGGIYGDKKRALDRLKKNIIDLPEEIKKRLTLENDDKSYTPEDLLPVCEELKIPFVYDVHHHRCLKDSLGEPEVSRRACKTWNREPLFHISSPKEGWEGPNPARHHDYIQIADFPDVWKEIGDLTVDVEAKCKELAVLKLLQELKSLNAVV